ncbi:hypothetical protein FOC1_g10008342 [Fusarium oxysporum f. sp. cubense race 1]|uniref:Uncharacterized protein n=1 Tax=Fusarium oxysporum f. sp. cubense (strain race 1) TaxID=1229664 RepID=N4UQA0_FUSC1|nr:hypothetical protein FOC1_g10008342 [Fusarium oxysporum f. sp. cubense race 1]
MSRELLKKPQGKIRQMVQAALIFKDPKCVSCRSYSVALDSVLYVQSVCSWPTQSSRSSFSRD